MQILLIARGKERDEPALRRQCSQRGPRGPREDAVVSRLVHDEVALARRSVGRFECTSAVTQSPKPEPKA